MKTELLLQKPIHVKPALYSFYIEIVKEIGLKYGYNIVPHGSLARDLDLIAIPWQDEIGDKEKMIDEIAEIIGGNLLMQNRSVDHIDGDRFGLKPHGRIVYIININRDFEMKYNGMVSVKKDYADPQYYLDISVIPSLSDLDRQIEGEAEKVAPSTLTKERVIAQLDKWIDDCEKQAEAFSLRNMLTSQISSMAMGQAYWNVKQFIEVNAIKQTTDK